MKRRAVEAVLGLSVGGGLLWWVLRGFSWETFLSIRQGWLWLLFAGGCMTVAHLLRAWRWHLMLRGSDASPHWPHPWWALMVGYLVNTALPRVGEVVRCTLLWRWGGVPVVLSLGSVVAERLLDVLILGLLSLSVVAVEGLGWLTLLGLRAYLLYFIIGGLGAMVGLGLFWHFWFKKRAHALVQQLVKGFSGILRARPQSLVWLFSLLIWVGYWGAIWGVMRACTEAHPETAFSSIGWAAWVLLVGSGVAMALPVPGGIGTFHAIGLVLLLSIGWQKDTAQLTVLAAHTLQTLLVLLLGGVGVLYGSVRYTPHSEFSKP